MSSQPPAAGSKTGGADEVVGSNCVVIFLVVLIFLVVIFFAGRQVDGMRISTSFTSRKFISVHYREAYPFIIERPIMNGTEYSLMYVRIPIIK